MTMRKRWLVVCAWGALAAACAGNDQPAGPTALLSGTWVQSGNLTDPINHQSHIHLGTFAIVQVDDTFSGTGKQTGLCNGQHGATYTGPLADGVPYAITNGVLSGGGTTVEFTTPVCQYTGTFAPGRTDRIAGLMSCTYLRNDTTFQFSGPWLADRQ